jgi:hypothetical protein
MDIRKKIILGWLIVSIFIFLVAVLVFVFALYSQGQAIPSILEPFIEWHMHFMVLMGLFGVLSGLMVFSILNTTIEKQKQVVKMNTDIIMKFLTEEDREIVQLLLSKQGMTTQSEIAKLPGMTRLKAHRIVKKLEDRGVVHVEKYGKINMIRIVDELKGMQ